MGCENCVECVKVLLYDSFNLKGKQRSTKAKLSFMCSNNYVIIKTRKKLVKRLLIIKERNL